ncbi:acyl carrier protein, partial [Actinacidiphila bryophytorum]
LAQRFLLAVKDVLGSTSTDVGLDEPLTGFGLDSLMAVELRNEIQNTLGITLQITDFLGGATIRSVAGRIVEGLAAEGTAPRDGAEAPQAIRRVPRAADVSADVAAGLLAELTGSAAHEPGTEARP